MRNIEWLKNEILTEMRSLEGNRNIPQWDVRYLALREVVQRINQIDKLANFIMSEVEGEPSQSQSAVDTAIRIIKSYQDKEMLSQEWIDEHKREHDEYPSGAPVLLVDDVEELLVPKNEKPVIPKFVAEWIEKYREHESNVWHLMDNVSVQNLELGTWLWGENNADVLARAWLDGFTVEYEAEEEPLYRARLKVITNESIASYLRTQSSDSEEGLKALEIGSKYIHEDYRHLSEFTEDELRVIGIWGSEQWEIEEVEE